MGESCVAPRLRGVLHAAALPLAFAAGVVLVALAPGQHARIAALVYSLSVCALFGTSALYHLGRWSMRRRALLRRLDHSLIYLVIAGTYTPVAVLALEGGAREAVLWTVWVGALAGAISRVLWVCAPRWVHVPLYVVLGWMAALVLPELLRGAGVAAVVLVIVGGALYTLGGLVYALGRPDPAPRVFGFHEVFHALTIAAFATQYVAISLVTYSQT